MTKTSFFGNTPYQGKIKVHDTSPDNLMGFIEITNQLNPYSGSGSSLSITDPGVDGSNFGSSNGMAENLLMYFKDYDYTNRQFKDLIIDENEVCNFNIFFLRIPSDLDYVFLKQNGEQWERNIFEIKDRYQGITICNIHKEEQEASNEISFASSFFLKPDFHAASNGKCGCSKCILIGRNRSPVFKHNSKFYILGLNTDSTPCYFATSNWTDIEKALNVMNSTPSQNGLRLGFAHHGCSQYNAKDFSNRFGIHVLEGGWNTDPNAGFGWEVGHYGVIGY